MNLNKQTQLISEGIENEIIDHKKLILWIDEIIGNSKTAEDWMIKLSLSKKNDLEKIKDVIDTQFQNDFTCSLTEYIAIIAAKIELKKIPAFNCLTALVVEKDYLKIDPDDIDSITSKDSIEEIENDVETRHFSSNAIDNAEVKLKDLLCFAKKKHSDIFNFMLTHA
ncbi:MAG TPA: hypothetical protein ENJ08_11365 [Gammaproteobacteria bacterium]|nr:hypothetical protein [Gammaproteobacteria bacterium]